MDVILIKKVEKLGAEGNVVKVKDGFARNFLLPRGYAKTASKANMEYYERIKARQQHERENQLKELRAFAARIDSVSCTIPVSVAEEDRLYGSVSGVDICGVMESEGITLDKKQIELEEPIKKLGIYNVNVVLDPEVKAVLKVWVVKK